MLIDLLESSKAIGLCLMGNLISQEYLMKTKLLQEYLRLGKRPRFETGVTSFV